MKQKTREIGTRMTVPEPWEIKEPRAIEPCEQQWAVNQPVLREKWTQTACLCLSLSLTRSVQSDGFGFSPSHTHYHSYLLSRASTQHATSASGRHLCILRQEEPLWDAWQPMQECRHPLQYSAWYHGPILVCPFPQRRSAIGCSSQT